MNFVDNYQPFERPQGYGRFRKSCQVNRIFEVEIIAGSGWNKSACKGSFAALAWAN